MYIQMTGAYDIGTSKFSSPHSKNTCSDDVDTCMLDLIHWLFFNTIINIHVDLHEHNIQ